MNFDFKDHFLFTANRMQEDIRMGRRAIEYGLLQAYLRPHSLSLDDEAEIAELFDLLDKYDEVMARYQLPATDSGEANNG